MMMNAMAVLSALLRGGWLWDIRGPELAMVVA
jgi:hypothetical protein